MVEGSHLVAHGSSELKAYSFAKLAEVVGHLLTAAAGQTRADISADDLLRTLFGIFYSQPGSDGQPTASRLVDVFVDGLRTR